jgi:predicted RNase H-like HicB family nuclease
MKVKVLVHPTEEGGFWAEVPALPGCVTEGENWEELLANLREAVEGCLLTTSRIFEPADGGQVQEIELL